MAYKGEFACSLLHLLYFICKEHLAHKYVHPVRPKKGPQVVCGQENIQVIVNRKEDFLT